MAYKILSVSIFEEKIDILKLEQGVTNTYIAVSPPQFDVDEVTLGAAAAWADKIVINDPFPSAEYQWQVFPKTSTGNLKQLVTRAASRSLGVRQAVRVGFQDQGPVVIDGITKRDISFIAVEEEKVTKWERKLLRQHRNKIGLITSMPVALSGAVVQSEHPKKDFMVVWVGEVTTIFVISSPLGDVKVARNIPVGLSPDPDGEQGGETGESFIEELDRDIMTTLLLYNDLVEEPACEKFYLLGNKKLKHVIGKCPLESVDGEEIYSLDHIPVGGAQVKMFGVYHLLGNLYCRNGYNLVDPAIIFHRKFNQGFKYASILLVGSILCASGWMLVTMPPGKAVKQELYAEKQDQFEQEKNTLYRLETREIELQRYSGWKDFYKNTYTNQPAWSELFSDLAQALPKEFVINSLEIFPGNKKGIHGWNCFLRGQIKIARWGDGLKLFRLFGARMQKSPFFEIVDVRYTPEEDAGKGAGAKNNTFKFTIKMTLTPREMTGDAG